MAAKILSNNGGSTSYRGCLAEQTREQRDQLRTDENDAATAHELLHALGLCTRIVVAISFHQIDNTPNAKTCANSHNESLQNGNRLIKEFHILFSPDRRFDEYLRFQKGSGLAHLRCCPLPAILASPFIFNKVSLLESHDRWWLFRVGHTDHLFRVCPNGWEGVSLAVDKSLLPYPCACSVTSTS